MGEALPRIVAGGRPRAATCGGGPEPAGAHELAHTLYERYSGRVLQYCVRRLGSRQEAEDAMQSTFLYVLHALDRGVVPLSEEAWLFAIARNVCLSRGRTAGSRRSRELTRDPQDMESAAPARETGADELFGVHEALASLPERQRQALLMREWRGLSYAEIGARLGLGQPAVESLLFRARHSLARALESGATARRRARRGLDAGLLAGWLRSSFAGGSAAKVAAGVASVAAVTALSVDALREPAQPPATSPARAAAAMPTREVASTGSAQPVALAARSAAPVRLRPRQPRGVTGAPASRPRDRAAAGLPRTGQALTAAPTTPREASARAPADTQPQSGAVATDNASPGGPDGDDGGRATGDRPPTLPEPGVDPGPVPGGLAAPTTRPGTDAGPGSVPDGPGSLLDDPAAILGDPTALLETVAAVVPDPAEAVRDAGGVVPSPGVQVPGPGSAEPDAASSVTDAVSAVPAAVPPAPAEPPAAAPALQDPVAVPAAPSLP